MEDRFEDMKKHIFVYNIIPLNSTGIYLADSKEEALRSLSEEVWDNVDPSFFEDVKVNVFGSIEIFTWDEYKSMGNFDISDRLLELAN